MARVLIIDDDVTLRQVLTKHLERAGHDVRQAARGDERIRAYQRRAADVVIVDILMPGQGGLQTIDQLRPPPPAATPLATARATPAALPHRAAHTPRLSARHRLCQPPDPAQRPRLSA